MNLKEEIVQVVLDERPENELAKCVNLVRMLSMEITRKQAQEWNEFLTMCL